MLYRFERKTYMDLLGIFVCVKDFPLQVEYNYNKHKCWFRNSLDIKFTRFTSALSLKMSTRMYLFIFYRNMMMEGCKPNNYFTVNCEIFAIFNFS